MCNAEADATMLRGTLRVSRHVDHVALRRPAVAFGPCASKRRGAAGLLHSRSFVTPPNAVASALLDVPNAPACRALGTARGCHGAGGEWFAAHHGVDR